PAPYIITRRVFERFPRRKTDLKKKRQPVMESKINTQKINGIDLGKLASNTNPIRNSERDASRAALPTKTRNFPVM
ncbi:hypothetical protein N9A93_07080, partial [Akkermansiaceae bacterium]|nr:hypothetical protein [Akkermansiaceae bacterium]